MVTSTITHLSKSVVLLAYMAVLVSACAPVGYIKPGMTEEEVTRELSECTEIARRQAFMDFRFDAPSPSAAPSRPVTSQVSRPQPR